MIFISFVYLTTKLAVLCSAAVLRDPQTATMSTEDNLETLSQKTHLGINDAADFRDPPNVATCRNSHYNGLSLDSSLLSPGSQQTPGSRAGVNSLPSSEDTSARPESSASGDDVQIEKRELEPWEKTIHGEWFISDCPTQTEQQKAYTSLELIWNPLLQTLTIGRKFNIRLISQQKIIYSRVEPGHPAIGFEGNFSGTFCIDFPHYKCTYGHAAHFVGNVEPGYITAAMYTSQSFGDFAPHVTETCIPVVRNGDMVQQVGPSVTGPCRVQVNQQVTSSALPSTDAEPKILT